MGTVELTGLEMMLMMAFGQYLAHPSAKVFTMPACSKDELGKLAVQQCLTSSHS